MASTPIIAIHGGAGTITRSAISATQEKTFHEAMNEVLQAGKRLLQQGASAVDVVAEAVRMLEDCPLFNAGKGAVLTAEGKYELDACVMDGASLAAIVNKYRRFDGK